MVCFAPTPDLWRNIESSPHEQMRCSPSPVVKETILGRSEIETGHRGAVINEYGSDINFAGYSGWKFNEIYSVSLPKMGVLLWLLLSTPQESRIIYDC